jgi:hypothetical protein
MLLKIHITGKAVPIFLLARNKVNSFNKMKQTRE